MRRILFLARAEVLHVVRDHATLAQVLVLPIVQLLVLSNAATFEIQRTPMYLVDHDRTGASRHLVQRFGSSGHFDIVDASPSMNAANDALLDGAVTLVLTIPRGFEESLVRTSGARVQLSLNAEKGSAAGVVQGYASRILNDFAASRGSQGSPGSQGSRGSQGSQGSVEISVRSRYNPTLNYKHYMVPGLLVALVTIIGTLLSAQNIAREKEMGTLEQLNVTPLTRGQFIVAKLLPFWVLALVDLTLGLIVGRVVFDIPMRGSLLLLFGSAAVYLIVALAIGLFISTLVSTQQQAMFTTFFIMIVYLLMSGLFTPVDSMAGWVQTLSLLNPVRHFVTISRAILIKGAGLAEIAQPLAILAVYGAAMLTLAIRQHRKRSA